MAEMAAALAAVHLDLQIAVDRILLGADRVLDRRVEARPAGIAFVFRLRDEQRLVAASAQERARPRLVIERAASRRLGREARA